MNKSSSSYHNNSSLLSLNSSTNEPCCSHQLQYSSLYQQLSSLRIEHRSLKHENTALRTTNRGLEEQAKLLKQFLTNKKEMITQLNYQLENGQKQIDRLEDQLRKINESNKEWQESKQEMKVIQEELGRLNQEVKEKDQRALELEREIERVREEGRVKIQRIKRENMDEIKHITEALEQKMENIMLSFNKTRENSKETSHCFTSATFTYEQMPKNNSSSSSPTKRPEFSLEKRFETLFDSLSKHQNSFVETLTQKQTKLSILQTRIQSLESQLTSSIELIHEQTSQMNDLRRKSEEKEQQKNVEFGIRQEEKKEQERIVGGVVRQMAKIIREVLPESEKIVEKIVMLIVPPQNSTSSSPLPQKFETQILLNELLTISGQSHSHSLKTSIQTHQFQRLTLDHTSLQQTHELLALKYSTLYRQYQHVMEDNSRLIKYNGLSKYRMSRNLTGLREFEGIEKGKQNEKVHEKTPGKSPLWWRESNKENEERTSNG